MAPLTVNFAQGRLALSNGSGPHRQVMLPCPWAARLAGSALELPNGSSGRLLSRDPEAMESVAERGWVESVGRRTPGLGSVSAPVMLRDQMIATLCLAMPLSRVDASPGKDFGEKVVRAARRIGAELEEAKQL